VDITLTEAFTFFLSARQKNFYARVISALIRQEVPNLGTVGVGISEDGRFVFYYDPAFVATLNIPKFLLILEHEVYHLILAHIPRAMDLMSTVQSTEEEERYDAAMPIAWDCAVNELMRAEEGFDQAYGRWFYKSEENPHAFLIPETFYMDRNQPFEVYQFALLSRMQEDEEESGATTYSVPVDAAANGSEANGGSGGDEGGEAGDEGSGGDEGGEAGGEAGGGKGATAVLKRIFQDHAGDAHKFWDANLKNKSSEELQGLAERLRHDAKSLVQKAIHDHDKSRGTIPGAMQELIDALLVVPTIPWPQVLRSVCMRTRQTKVSRGMSRPSRRMHGVHGVLPFPGRARDNKFTLWYVLDTSGSMHKADLAMGLAELINITRSEPEVSIAVMYCDAHLHVTYDVKRVSDVDFNVVGRGGTNFNPPFIKLREMMHTDKAPDAIVYCTDGYAPAPAPENRVPIPVIWLITPRGVEPSPDYGIHIRMEPFNV